MAAITRLGLYGGTRGLYGSFAGKVEQVIEEVFGGIRKRKIKSMPKHFMPWEKEEDEYIEEIIEEIKAKPKLKVVKRAPQPDFDSTLSLERIDRELVLELQESERIRKKRIRRRKTIEMLLLS